ncbi:Asp23/Gls24 family envelope stress response protein [Amycolatopsis sp. 195334CR]|uniref:Asp23/Gls24 family envelope stress response protein n=1 Tax=Amycolatopsis sp. 195334CR TaxID=2814588 RepID=UPI001A8DE0D9|nr:Asp23/Gls24 family envelope stress response protein [Amycolatopsis sp. 195334CR]MBN6038497.1 Asp23/Gls24 family envelope stress response protein [Amycolatopsis sp. 195334CR]
MTATTHTPAEERGELTIAEQAVRRLAAHAVLEVDGVGGAAGRVLGVSLGTEHLDRTAKVDAEVRNGTVDLNVRLSLTYPAPVAATTERAREHLIDRVGGLTGMPVRRVDITVTALHPNATAARRVE